MHLAKFGVTVQQAKDFINSNSQNPADIFQAAQVSGVTTKMLSELSGYSVDIVSGYFGAIDLQSKKLDDTHILVNSDLGSLESLVTHNEKDDILSNASLHAAVIKKLQDLNQKTDDYENFFTNGPTKQYQDDDGIYDADELGVCSLTTGVPATAESLESLFNGSLINIFSALDDTELNQIKEFPNKESEEYQSLLLSTLSTAPTATRSDTDLATLVVSETINISGQYWHSELSGILDLSYLGIATI